MINRYKTQSISVNEEELQAIKELAARARMKPATLARGLFYRGLAAFLKDGSVYAEETEDQTFQGLWGKLTSQTGFAISIQRIRPVSDPLSELSDIYESLSPEDRELVNQDIEGLLKIIKAKPSKQSKIG